jgi:hypothetical protein
MLSKISEYTVISIPHILGYTHKVFNYVAILEIY